MCSQWSVRGAAPLIPKGRNGYSALRLYGEAIGLSGGDSDGDCRKAVGGRLAGTRIALRPVSALNRMGRIMAQTLDQIYALQALVNST